jgi:hypothetical protein
MELYWISSTNLIKKSGHRHIRIENEQERERERLARAKKRFSVVAVADAVDGTHRLWYIPAAP